VLLPRECPGDVVKAEDIIRVRLNSNKKFSVEELFLTVIGENKFEPGELD